MARKTVTLPVPLVSRGLNRVPEVYGHLFVATARDEAPDAVAICLHGHGVDITLEHAQQLVRELDGDLAEPAVAPACDALDGAAYATVEVEPGDYLPDTLGVFIRGGFGMRGAMVPRVQFREALTIAIGQRAIPA